MESVKTILMEIRDAIKGNDQVTCINCKHVEPKPEGLICSYLSCYVTPDFSCKKGTRD